MTEPSLLSFSVAYGRVGVVVLEKSKLRHWHISDAAYRSSKHVTTFVHALVHEFGPKVVVTEKLNQRCRKGKHSQALIAAINKAAREHEIYDIGVERQCAYANKYAEADALVERHPELKPWIPKRTAFYDKEPRSTVIFEALAQAEAAMLGPNTNISGTGR